MLKKCLALLGCLLLIAGTALADTADDTIVSVKAYGFVDLEGAKLSAIIVEYAEPIDGSSVSADTYTITDYTILQEQASGYASAIEMDYDGIEGNEGQITRVYVNDVPETAEQGKDSGRYVIIEVNTAYMLSGQNLVYTSSMIAGATQVLPVLTADGRTVEAGTKEIGNYTESESAARGGSGTAGGSGTTGGSGTAGGRNGGRGGNGGTNGGQSAMSRVSRTADKDKIILPEFAEGTGWTINYIGDGAFRAENCYSEYTGEYVDFELPYSIYVPDAETLEANKGHVALVIHMEHAGSNDSDPMAAITSSRAAAKLSGSAIQSENPAIIVVPQVEESRRSTDDLVASSEVNTAVWELLDSLLEQYADYIDTDRIYGTGQSMGGMTILNMAAQRDNFFAGIAVVGAQWSNSYNKDFQHSGAAARTPETDPISFSGDSVDAENFANWYYMISDDNILVQTCVGDEMASGEWKYLKEYIDMAGGSVAYAEWDPYLSVEEQNTLGAALLDRDTTGAGMGLTWAGFTRGTHMSTWKYGYQLDYPFEWLFAQTRQTEQARGKLTQLLNPWLGRDENGQILAGSGTAGMNSAQFDTSGTSRTYTENWTPVSVVNAAIEALPEDGSADESSLASIRTMWDLLTEEEKAQILHPEKIQGLTD